MGFETLSFSTTSVGWRCRVAVPDRHPAFDGHFPGHPVLPGIAHLAIVAHVLGEITGRGARMAAVPLLRLRRPVVPGDVLEVRITWPSKGEPCEFEVRRGEERLSNGIVSLDEDE